MQALYLEALGLKETQASEELVKSLEKAVGGKTLFKNLPKILSKLTEEGSLTPTQRNELRELNPKKLPKDLIQLTALDFQQRMGTFKVSPPVATVLFLHLQLELINLASAHRKQAEGVAKKAGKKKWEGAGDVEKIAGNWIEFLDRQRYALARRIETVGQGGTAGGPSLRDGPKEPPGGAPYRKGGSNARKGDSPYSPPIQDKPAGSEGFKPPARAPQPASGGLEDLPGPGAGGDDPFGAEKAEPSSGSSQHSESTMGHGDDPFQARSESFKPPTSAPTDDGGLPDLTPAPKQDPFGAAGGLPDLTPAPSKTPFDEPTPQPTTAPAPAPASRPVASAAEEEQTPDIQGKVFDGRDYKFFIKGKGVKMVEFKQTQPGRAVLEVEQKQKLLEDWMERQDPTVAYLIEKSGTETIPIQGCLVMERKVVYEIAFRTGLDK